METNYLYAVIVEGEAEKAIIDVLLDHNLLIFTRDQMLNEEVIRTRIGKSFAAKYLSLSFPKNTKIKICRILDSRNERFKIPKAYMRIIDSIDDYLTRPEIEILFIIDRNDQNKLKSVKPSTFVKNNYRDLKQVKSYQTVYQYWNSNIDNLVRVLKKYKHSKKNELAIADLLK